MGIDYNPNLDENSKTKVLILASAHLRGFKDGFNPSLLEPLLSVLQDFNPNLIGVEDIPPPILEEMERRGGIFAKTIKVMAEIRVAESKAIEFGHTARKIMRVSRQEAESKADVLLQTEKTLDSDTRLQAVAYLLAAYDYNSALLQWSYLSENMRGQNKLLPDEITAQLNQSLHAPNESVSIGIALARRLQHQKIVSIDDQLDVAIYAKIPPQVIKELQDHPQYKAMVNSEFFAEEKKHAKSARQSGDEMLKYYLYMNSPEYASMYVPTEWGMYFRTKLPSGMDRSRVAQWEVRNLNIASHIREATALHPSKRMLVIIGSAHKPFLDAYLSQMLDIKLVQLRDLVRTRADETDKGNFSSLTTEVVR